MQKKKEILLAASNLFGEKGDRFTLEEVGNAVGIKKASIYSHFQNKEEIIILITAMKCRDYEEYMNHVFLLLEDEGDAEKSFKMIYDAITTYFNKNNNFKFFKHIELLPNPALKEQCKSPYYRLNNRIKERVKGLWDRADDERNNCPQKKHYLTEFFFNHIEGVLNISYFSIKGRKMAEAYQEIMWVYFRRAFLKE